MRRTGNDALSLALRTYRDFAAIENKKLRRRLQDRIGDSPLIDQLSAELDHQGKHLRPALTLASYQIFAKSPEINYECLAAAHALEIFHTFVLIHDDVIDRSEQRRNRPTLHRRIEEQLQVSAPTGNHLAIVLGDILFGYAINLLSTPETDHALIGPLQHYLSSVTEDTGLGEAQELTFLKKPLAEISPEQIEQVYYLKTTRYTIEAPLWLGGRAAGVPEEQLAPLIAFARPIGLGFQLENDLHEASLPLEQFRHLAYDFQTGVKTLFLRRLYEDLGPTDRKELEEVVLDCQENESSLTRLYELIHSTSTLPSLRDEVENCFATARAWIPQSPYSAKQKQRLEKLIDFIFSQRKHSETVSTRR